MEDNKDLMVTENEELEPVEETEEVQGSFGAGIVLGGVLALGAYALIKKGIAVWKAHKSKEPTVEKTDPKVIDITPDPVDSDEETE